MSSMLDPSDVLYQQGQQIPNLPGQTYIPATPVSGVPPAADPSQQQQPTPPPGANQQTIAQSQGLVLGRNPQLPQTPMGQYQDSQYEADLAALKYDITTRYNDMLSQLGYKDDNGNFIPGTVEIDANRQRSDLSRSSDLAREQTTQQMQQMGTLFSGLRGTAQARAEFPFQSAMSDLDVNTPRTLNDLYQHASGLSNEFMVRHAQLLADASARAAANLQNQLVPGGSYGNVNQGANQDPSGMISSDALQMGPVAPPTPQQRLSIGTLPNIPGAVSTSLLRPYPGGSPGLPSVLPSPAPSPAPRPAFAAG